MNIVLPLGRLGHVSEESNKPLQLTLILGRPMLFWLLDSLELDVDSDVVWLILSASDEEIYQICSAVRAEYRSLSAANRLRFIPLHFRTQGVAETLHVAVKYMSSSDLERKTICLNGDMIFSASICQMSRQIQPQDTFCFLTTGELLVGMRDEEKRLFQYCTLDESTRRNLCGSETYQILAIHEEFLNPAQSVIIGAYTFGTGYLLKAILECVLQKAQKYDARVGFPDIMKSTDTKLGILLNPDACAPLKTFHQLQSFADRRMRELPKTFGRSTRYLFQMYGGIMDDQGRPRQHLLRILETLRALGHHVTISSSRGRGSNAVKDFMNQLDEFCISYDEVELHDDDKDFTVVVGANNVDIHGDLNKALGIPRTFELTAVKPRHFNKIVMSDLRVLKTSSVESLTGEAFFYENIPKELLTLFPKFISKVVEGEKMTIAMSKVEGTTFSQLLVNRCVNDQRLALVLECLKNIHDHGNGKTCGKHADLDFYFNYARKVHLRYQASRDLYESIYPGILADLIEPLTSALDDYESGARADIRNFVHGDPVFSNCLLSFKNALYFIDMKGRQGLYPTTAGDSAYDLAKILQSLYGYDYILLNVTMKDEDDRILRTLRGQLRDFVNQNYVNVCWKDLELITASLLVSLIPLHNELAHQKSFLELGRRVFKRWQEYRSDDEP